MPESLAEFFLQHFGAHRRECAYHQRHGYRTQSFTYGQVMTMTFAFAHKLEARRIAKGDRVMLWGANSAECAAAFFGCALTGVIVVPMDDAATTDFAARVATQVQARLLVASASHINDCAAAGVSTATLPLDDLSRAVDIRTANPPPPNSPPAPISLHREDPLQIVFTSGTTAEPRGVVITHGNVLANIAPIEREMEPYLKYERLMHPLRFLNLLPLSHVFGQFLGMFLPPLLGGTVIFQDELKPSEVANTIQRERVSVLVSVPRVLQALKQKVERDLEDQARMPAFRQRFVTSKDQHFLRRWWTFRAIRREFGWKFLAMISGGAALDATTEEFWGRLGYAVIQGYGLTETTSLVSVNHPFKLSKGSIGKVLPGRELKLADDGEILVRGAGVASGYWNGGGRISGDPSGGIADDQGWYRTGDVGALDDAGNLYFKGRKKEVIVTPAGMNVYPEDLEAALRREPQVKDCVVVGIDRDGNAEPCAVLILRDQASPEEIVQRANQSLAEYQRMRTWIEWPGEDFPRTSTQKSKRAMIAQAVRQKMLHESPPFENRGEPALSLSKGLGTHFAESENKNSRNATLADLIARVSGRHVTNLNEDANLDSDLGLSSLDRVELLSAVEDRYQVDLSEARFSTVRTVGDLERMLRGDATRTTPYHYPGWTLRWPATWLRWLAQYLLMRPAIVLLGWPRIEGRENLRGVRGPLLAVCNHVGDIDPGFILTALPARFRHRLATATGGEALEALRSPSPDRNLFLRIYDRVQWTLGVSLLNLFPLPREAGFRRSFAYAGEAIDRGYSVLVFPEGRHTTDGKMNPFRSGIGLLALNLRVPVLPMRIDGLYEPKAAGKWFVAPWTIRVKIGKPLRFDEETDPAKIAARLQEAVTGL